MFRRLLALFVLSVLFCFQTKAQRAACQLKGQIKDEEGRALPWVAVVLRAVDGEELDKVYAYTYTDENGYYCLRFSLEKGNSEQWMLTVSLLGFESQSVILDLLEGGNEVVQNFILSPTHFIIKQVVVVDSLSFDTGVFDSDTTEYHVEDYSDSTEYYLEELLKKMPGVEIDNSGRLTVHGKTVKKVLVEGDDFFGANYSVLTKNMQASLVDRIQVIDYYQENPVLKGLLYSNDLVLNLVLKEEVKEKPSGRLSMGIGYGDVAKWSLGANVFTFRKKYRGILLLNGDNISSDFWQEASDALSQMDGSAHVELPKRENLGVVRFSNPDDGGLSPRFSLRRQSGLGAYSQVFDLKPTWKLRFSTIGQWSENGQQQISSTTFFLLDSLLFSLKEERAFRQFGRRWGSLALLQHQAANQKSSLMIAVEAGGNHRKEDINLIRTTDHEIFFWPAEVKSEPLHCSFLSEYTRKVGARLAWQATVRASREKGEEFLGSQFTVYPAFFGRDSSLSELLQSSRFSQSLYSGFLRLLGAYGSYGFEAQIGGNAHAVHLLSSLFLSNEAQKERIEGGAYQTDLVFEQDDLYLGGTAYLLKKAWFLQGGVRSVYVHSRWRQQEEKNSSFWLPACFVESKYTRNSKTKFTLRYSYGPSLSGVADLNASFVFVTPFVLYRGRPYRDIQPRHLFRLLFRHSSDSYGRYVYLSVQASRAKRRSLSTLLSPFLQKKEAFFPASQANVQASARIEQLFSSLNLLISLKGWYRYMEGENRLSQVPRQWRQRQFGVNFFGGTAFDFPLNLHLENRLSFTQMTITSFGVPFRQKGLQWVTHLKISLLSSEKLFGDLNFYRLATYFSKERTALLFVSEAAISFRFRLKKRPSFLSLRVSNLTNTSSLDYFFFTDWAESTSSIQAVPRFFLIKMDLPF